ncbi:MAG: single-stranded-DNA-specific exonuclease RecJ [Planctomycetota bacterium]
MERAAFATPEPDPRERALARTLGVPDLVARVLLSRGFDDPDRARTHLRPDLRQLHDPFLFRGMDRAVARVRDAMTRGERILVHGDYDVDGIAGSVLLRKLFGLVQTEARIHIPRREDGYSFTAASVRAIADGDFKLCISVDNGTNAVEAIEHIQARGCDVIVTDHHGTLENTARPHTLINPRLPEAGYPDRDLAGCGVAFRLATALAHSFSRGTTHSDEFREFLTESLAYVALGTIADVAPLRGENRVLVSHGLRALAASPNPGIRALLDAAGIGSEQPDVEDVAFRIAPLINAAGRMGQASDAVDLLMANGYQPAQEAAKQLEAHNERRRKVERELLEEATRLAAERPEPILVIAGEGWHQGVLGIVAARLAETSGRPALLLTIEGGRARGSGRSAGCLDLRQALASCSEVLTAHGGHAAAVGLELPAENVDLFRERINTVAGGEVRPRRVEQPDGCAGFDELDVRTLRQLDQLGPFGIGNPRPTFVTAGVRLLGRPALDPRGADLRLRVAQNGQVLPARVVAGASRCEELRERREHFRLVYTPRASRWVDEGPVELVVSHLEAEATT